jgi:hypothetical protein
MPMTDPTLTSDAAAPPEAAAPPAEERPAPEDPRDAAPPERPDYLPEKFWDAEQGAVRTEALARSYAELERRLGAAAGDVPRDPDGYAIDPPNEWLAPDPAVNARLHEAGLTRAQAQLVYDLGAEVMMPMVADLAAEFEAERQRERLREHFGGDGRFREASRQLDAWGRAHLPPPVFEALSATYEGVLALQAMMEGGEPGLGGASAGNSGDAADDEHSLRRLMADPRYWRDQDPSLVARVRAGFARLYPERD